MVRYRTVVRRLLVSVFTIALAVVVMAALPITDTFIRANNASLGANWSQDGAGGATIGIVSNTATMTGNSNFVVDYYGSGWGSNGGGDDQYSELVITTIQSGRDTGPAVRCTGSPVTGTGKCFLFVLNDNDAAHSMGDTNFSIALYSVINTGFSQIGSSVTGVTISTNDVIRLEVTGTGASGLVGKINGVSKITGSASTVTTGTPGFYIGSGASTVWGNGTTGFTADNLGGGGGVVCGSRLLRGVGC